MLVKIKVNGKLIQDDVQPQTLLLDWLRDHGCYSVKEVVIPQTVDYVQC